MAWPPAPARSGRGQRRSPARLGARTASTPPTSGRDGADSRQFLACCSQPFRRALGCDVSLTHAQHFKADHKFAHGCRTQQRRIEMTVEVALRVLFAVSWPLVKAHSVRETDREQTVVAHRHALENIG